MKNQSSPFAHAQTYEVNQKDKMRELSSNYLGSKSQAPPQSSHNNHRKTFRKVTSRKSGGDDFNMSRKNLEITNQQLNQTMQLERKNFIGLT